MVDKKYEDILTWLRTVGAALSSIAANILFCKIENSYPISIIDAENSNFILPTLKP